MKEHEAVSRHEVRLHTDFGLEASINPDGAFLESLRAGNRDLILPRQDIDGKDRGGVPICAPVFGPQEQLGLEQHGFARKLPWQTSFTSEDKASFLLDIDQETAESYGIPAEYIGNSMQAIFAVGSASTNSHWLNVILKIQNKSNSNSQVVAPGIHPYFPLSSNQSADNILIGSKNSKKTYNEISLKDAATLREPQTNLEFDIEDENHGRTSVQISSNDLTNFVLWTNSPDRFVCVEPTLAGAVGLENTIDDLHTKYGLSPGQTKEYTARIVWNRQINK